MQLENSLSENDFIQQIGNNAVRKVLKLNKIYLK